MVMRTQPTLSLGMSARIAEVANFSPSSFCKRYRSSYETPSSSSLTLPIRMRYRGTSELILDTEFEDESSDLDDEGEGSEDEGPGLDDEGHGLEDEGPGLKEEEVEAAHKGQQQAVLVVTWVDPKDGRVYTNILTYPPAAPRYQFRSLEQEQERATMTFSAIWRPILALEAWTGQTDAQKAALWHAIYNIQRENNDLRRQITEERRERLELTNRIARMERTQESGGE
ncbi:hypothetical protein Tco_1008079 [Tanacetum coccineum]